MTNTTEYPSFESVYLLTQRNAEAIQRLGEKLDAMLVREEERNEERRLEAAKVAKREEERRLEAAKREEERRLEAAKREEKRRLEAAKREEKRRLEAAKREEERRAEAAEEAKRDKERKAELDRITKEMRRRTNKLDELFTSQWGKLVEALVDGKVVEILNERQIKVEQTSQRCEGVYDGKTQEIDILAINGEEIVAIEVKTTLRPEDVGAFEDKLKVLKLWMRHYADKKVYGAVAYIRADAGSAELAAKRGLFVIKAVGDSARLTNTKSFKPRTF